MKESTTAQTTNHSLLLDNLGSTCAILLLRVWLGIRCFQAGIEKFGGTQLHSQPTIVDGKPDPNKMETVTSLKFYAFENYNGVPESLSRKLGAEPLITDWFLTSYNATLGPLLIVIGLCVLLGIATRFSLFAMGLLYTTLTYGLILLNQSSGIAWLGTHILLIALALMLANYNRLELGNGFAKRFELKWLLNK